MEQLENQNARSLEQIEVLKRRLDSGSTDERLQKELDDYKVNQEQVDC